MKLRYPVDTIWAARSEAEDNGHAFSGKAKRIGLSYALTCTQCKRSAVVTPAWYPWEHDEVRGIPLMSRCGA